MTPPQKRWPVKIIMTPPFRYEYKTWNKKQKKAANEALAAIAENPSAGVPQKGDLDGARLYELRRGDDLIIVSYACGPDSVRLLHLGIRENFYAAITYETKRRMML